MKKHHACIVKWPDSSSLRGWNSLNHEQHGVSVITSIGWLARDTPKEITITTSITEAGGVMDGLTIPREAVTKITKLKHYIAGT